MENAYNKKGAVKNKIYSSWIEFGFCSHSK